MPRDGRVLEELGTYDPMVPETDARAMLNGERINYWLSVGAQPSDKVRVLIKKYGSAGTHLEAAAVGAWPGWRQVRAGGRSSQQPQAARPAEAAVAAEAVEDLLARPPPSEACRMIGPCDAIRRFDPFSRHLSRDTWVKAC